MKQTSKIFNILIYMTLLAVSSSCKVRRGVGVNKLKGNGIPQGQFRGLELISSYTKKLFWNENQPSDFGNIMPDDGRSMGAFHQGFRKSIYLGGTPNTGNTIQWLIFFSSLIDLLIEGECRLSNPEGLDVSPRSKTAFQELASYACFDGKMYLNPLTIKKYSEKVLEQFVLIPDSHLEDWRSYFYGDKHGIASDRELFKQMLLALLMDPYYLLEIE